MKPLKILSQRSLIRVISFTVAGFFVTLGFAVSGYATANHYKIALENSYSRALNDLGYYSTSINSTLTKGMYAGTNKQFLLLSSDLLADAAQAKSNLAILPQSQTNLATTYKFLSQVGQYAMALTEKVGNGGKITPQEWQNLQNLTQYSTKMTDEVEYMRALVMDDNYMMGLANRSVGSTTKNFKVDGNTDTTSGSSMGVPSSNGSASGQATPTVAANNPSSNPASSGSNGQTQAQSESQTPQNFPDAFDAMEKGFDGYPSLIYDGPFSDNAQNQKSVFTAGKKDITSDEAKKIATIFTQNSTLASKMPSQSNGLIPNFSFSADGTNFAVTKAGGYPLSMMMTRSVNTSSIKPEQAIEKAKTYLNSIGYKDMASTYYFMADNICTINFAYQQGGVVVYPDLIKVSVAMDNGQIVAFDATGYLMNHKTRTIPTKVISKEQGLKSVSPLLRVQSVKEVIIPATGNKEYCCYEYKCLGKKNENVLVYVNVQNGDEEQLLLLLQTDNGTLTL